MFIIFLIALVGLAIFIFAKKARKGKDTESAILSLILRYNYKIVNFTYLDYGTVRKYAIENGKNPKEYPDNSIVFSYYKDNTEYLVYVAGAPDGSAYISAEPKNIWIEKERQRKRDAKTKGL